MSALVTAHAVYRWLTRVQDLRIDEMAAIAGPNAPQHAMAEAGCSLLGMTIVEARAEILPGYLEPAVVLGCAKVRRVGFTLLCERGQVMTVVSGSAAHLGARPFAFFPGRYRLERRQSHEIGREAAK